MNRADRVVVGRIAGAIGLTIIVIGGILLLVESMNTGRFAVLSARGGAGLAVAGIIIAGVRQLLGVLPLVLLIGAIAGVIALQSSREMIIIKASGRSIWRVIRMPMLAVIVLGAVVTLAIDPLSIAVARLVLPASSSVGSLWLDQKAGDQHYIFEADSLGADGVTASNVSVFMLDSGRDRIEAPTATLAGGAWHMPTAKRLRSNAVPEALTDFTLPSGISRGDLEARLSVPETLTVYELITTVSHKITDTSVRAGMLTELFGRLALPLALCASLAIAFAFTAGYRRTNNYGGAVVYGIVLGFVVYVASEMAARAGDAGAISPAFAALGPPLVAIVTGVTVLLLREDGRT